MQKPLNLGRLFLDSAQRLPKKAAFLSKVDGQFEPIVWEEAAKDIRAMASAYLSMGIKTGDRIAIYSENRPEWAMADLAAQLVGIATVPIYPSLTSAEAAYILSDSGAALLVLSNKTQFEKILPIQKDLPNLKGVIAFDSSLLASKPDSLTPLFLWRDLVKTKLNTALDALAQAVTGDAIASIIYTSGTTGSPKGVLLTHRNFIANVVACRDTLRMTENDLHLSFLPLCHVFERTAGYYLMVYLGATIAYAEDLDSVSKNILEVNPTFLLGVPRFYEKIQHRVLEAVKKASPVRKALFFWAKEIGEAKRMGSRKKNLFSVWEERLAEKLVYKTFRRRLGGRLRFCVSGGAAIAKEIAEFFHDLGVMIYEGYGLTETSPVISVNRENQWRFGTVGVPLEGVEVKIAEDGEILTKSECVMKGYYQKPEETEAVLKNGWFYTGDLGKIDRDGFLSITGRKKDLIVTSGGKKVSPQPIEEALSKDLYILRCVLFGEGMKFITAILVPNKQELLDYAKTQKMAYTTYEELLKDQKIYEFMDSRVQAAMTDFSSYEKIKYFALEPNDFSQESGELTPTLKVRREVVYSRYKDRLLPFYSGTYSRD